MHKYRLAVFVAALMAGTQAHAVIAIPEPSTPSLMALGAVVTIFALRFLRR